MKNFNRDTNGHLGGLKDQAKLLNLENIDILFDIRRRRFRKLRTFSLCCVWF